MIGLLATLCDVVSIGHTPDSCTEEALSVQGTPDHDLKRGYWHRERLSSAYLRHHGDPLTQAVRRWMAGEACSTSTTEERQHAALGFTQDGSMPHGHRRRTCRDGDDPRLLERRTRGAGGARQRAYPHHGDED